MLFQFLSVFAGRQASWKKQLTSTSELPMLSRLQREAKVSVFLSLYCLRGMSDSNGKQLLDTPL